MAELHAIEKQGIALVTDYLRRTNRKVEPSRRKTFDLVVDGVHAEVKCKRIPWSQLDFIGFTDKQRRALDKGETFLLFVVCNLRDPAAVEIKEITSNTLRKATFKVESTHYIYGKQLKLLTERT